MNPAASDPFLEACGADGPLTISVAKRTVVDGPGAERRVVAQPFLVVGRLPRADVALDDPRVSRRHTYLQLIDGRLYGVDLGSRTGTFVDGDRLVSGWIESDEAVQVGPFGLRVRGFGRGRTPAASGGQLSGEGGTEAPSPLSSASGLARPDLAPAFLQVTGPGLKPRVWKMGSVLALIGNGPPCRPRLQDHRVAPFHCSLVRTPAGLWAVDLLTEWGILHNGCVVRSCRIAPGDRLGLGPFTICLLQPPPPPPARVAPSASTTVATSVWATPQGVPSPVGQSPTEIAVRRNTGEWQPVSSPVGSEVGVPAVPWEASQRLEALERRQEQMQDQFQQAILLMLKTFGGMHREQMDVLGAELTEVRRLSEAIDGLRAELGKSTLGDPLGEPAGRPASHRPRAATDSWPGSAKAAESSNGLSGRNGGSRGAHTPEAGGWAEPNPTDPEEPRIRRDPREVHALVSERLAAFERERQSRWNRILRALTGTA